MSAFLSYLHISYFPHGIFFFLLYHSYTLYKGFMNFEVVVSDFFSKGFLYVLINGADTTTWTLCLSVRDATHFVPPTYFSRSLLYFSRLFMYLLCSDADKNIWTAWRVWPSPLPPSHHPTLVQANCSDACPCRMSGFYWISFDWLLPGPCAPSVMINPKTFL